MKDFIIDFPVSWDDVHGEDIVFDMDGTLVEGDLGETVFYRCLLGSKTGDPDAECVHRLTGNAAQVLHVYRCNIRQGQLMEAYRFVAEWLESLPGEAVTAAARDILNADVAPHVLRVVTDRTDGSCEHELRYGARRKADMQHLIGTLEKKGAKCWIVSASPQKICEVLGEAFHIPDKRVLGVRAQNGSVFIPWHLDKVTALQERGVAQPLVAFGDSKGDREMLYFARHQVVMHGGDPALIKEAKKQRWHIYG